MSTPGGPVETVVDEMVRGGVRDVVLCPAGMSAAAVAPLLRAERAGRVRLHIWLDERAGGFLALGLAGGGTPVPVFATAESGGANLFPAVLEAAYAGVPMLVITAARSDSGTPFGRTVRRTLALRAEDAPGTWRSATCHALAAARGDRNGDAGPVHLLVPPNADPRQGAVRTDSGQGAVWTDSGQGALRTDSGQGAHGRPGDAVWTEAGAGVADAPVEIDVTAPTIVIAGHGAGAHPELAALPTVAEPTAPVLGPPLHPLALTVVRPRQVVVVGRPTLHRDVSRLLADPAVEIVALSRFSQWADVAGTVRAVGTRAVVGGAPAAGWLAACRAASERAGAVVRTRLASHGKSTGLHVAAEVLDALRPGDQLVLGASNAIRDVSWAGHPPRAATVLSNRGVAGIDGTVAYCAGSALRHPGRTVALMGDLTFLHDVSSLSLLRAHGPAPANPTIVVANDDGGGIFELLEQGHPKFAGAFDRIFGTPHGTELAALCRAHGVPHETVDLPTLSERLSAPWPGARVLEVPTDRSSLRDLHEGIRAAVSDAGKAL
ncbi:thiamine pyrophosphate-binding protein [Nocardia blacklockiae]|uniref:thiamine pyrophosphate-binding protein n=1 Tax=Nocardia blacklockiae TaxID=480036 RepID=UPI00189541BF|nr:thiamine pyrophosphate-binding protein [Nocardia blacklockiae]MBF6169879.1 2-succinyl-5-enolpyruvyl-6-hydroxy-3-cyclohexene-1-carboxylic-acid synthase [Nocardia blacklockiae]